MKLSRPLFCPICGAKVLCEVADDRFPEEHIIPDHMPATDVNLCQGAVVKVTLDNARCRECGEKMMKHPSGVCLGCYQERIVP